MTIPTLSIHELPFIKKLVKDYHREEEKLSHLYDYNPTNQGLQESLDSIDIGNYDLEVIRNIIQHNYSESDLLSEKEKTNINLLINGGKCVITAHQPCLFLGPLYTIIKAISAISISEKINKNIVPVFVVGGEDHDKEEILQCTIFNEKFTWETDQIGSVGQFTIDDSLIEVLDRFCEKLGAKEDAKHLKEIYQKHYKVGNTITKAFAGTFREFLGKYGLIVLDITIPESKKLMSKVWQDELENKIVVNTTRDSIKFLSENYHVQAKPRDINLFQYQDKERILIKESTKELINDAKLSPHLFSPNVTLRPLMQQKILPCVAYVGGASELSYWLELKRVFETYNTHFPTVLLRDMIIPIDEKSWNKWGSMALELQDFFSDIDAIKKQVVFQDSNTEKELEAIKTETLTAFIKAKSILEKVDINLANSFEAEKSKLEKSFGIIESKAIRAQKKQSENIINSIENIVTKVYPDGLIERKENICSMILKYDSNIIKKMKEVSNPIDNKLKLLVL